MSTCNHQGETNNTELDHKAFQLLLDIDQCVSQFHVLLWIYLFQLAKRLLISTTKRGFPLPRHFCSSFRVLTESQVSAVAPVCPSFFKGPPCLKYI